MKKLKLIALSMVVLVGLASCSSDDDNNTPPLQKQNYSASLSQLNDSGASGTVNISVEKDTLTVTIKAKGLVPKQAHSQHIYGKKDGSNSTCPTASADADKDGIITLKEGTPFYGDVILSLKDFPEADVDGNVSYTKTFVIGKNGAITNEALVTLENKVIVLHGLNSDKSYDATIPVACGEISRK